VSWWSTEIFETGWHLYSVIVWPIFLKPDGIPIICQLFSLQILRFNSVPLMKLILVIVFLQIYQFYPTNYSFKVIQRCILLTIQNTVLSLFFWSDSGVTDIWLLLQVKSHKDLAHFETAYVVKLHRVARLAPSQPVRAFLLYFPSLGYELCVRD